MEYTPEDPHPADDVLDTGNPLPSTYQAYSSVYRTVDWSPPQPVKQQLPGKADVTFANKVGMFDNPTVKLPDLKTVQLVTSKTKDGPSVEKVAADDSRTRRQLYEVSISAKMRRGSPGGAPEEFDTESIKKKYIDQGIGAFGFGETDDDNARFQELTKEWALKSLIWVCAIEKGRIGVTFYSHVGRPFKFHHSSFTSGGPMLAAGEWIVEKGELKKISGNSGHYRPSISELHRAVMFMSGAWHQDTEVMLYNIQKRNWEYVPVNVFKQDPSSNGKYRAHAAQQ